VRFGFRNFKVLFIVPDEERIESIHTMINRYDVPRQPGYVASQYLFNTFDALARDRNVLDGWVTCNGEEVALRT
jgi:hypothetical protein